ncbi:hypothetical protein TWF718_000731 [Orbilia javanica]|uniref:Uncharacterized protein n=1 Tax=Orbilia javanica TaxID=47235 RepID=A0AAN8RGN1_9PEZI
MSAPTDDSQLSSYSALWGLSALALTVMIQPTSRVCGFHPSIRIFLRSSPIVCIVDCICTVTRLGFYLFRYKLSFKAACQLTLCRKRVPWEGFSQWEQSYLDPGPSLQTEEQGGMSISGEGASTAGNDGQHQEVLGYSITFEEPTLARVLSMLLTAFPQWLKIVVCAGTPWTSTWASFYFWSFLVTEAITITAGKMENGNITDWPHVDSADLDLENRLGWWDLILGGLSILAQLVAILILEGRGGEMVKEIGRWRWNIMIVLIYMGSIAQFLGVYADRVSGQPSTPTFLNFVRFIFPRAVSLMVPTLFHLVGQHDMAQVIWILPILMGLSPLNLSQWTRERVLLYKGPVENYDGPESWFENWGQVRNSLAFGLMLKLFIVAVYQYLVLYNPESTQKPKWVEVFG